MSKETYYNVKRDLLQCGKRPTTMSKETYYNAESALLQCQKRPAASSSSPSDTSSRRTRDVTSSLSTKPVPMSIGQNYLQGKINYTLHIHVITEHQTRANVNRTNYLQGKINYTLHIHSSLSTKPVPMSIGQIIYRVKFLCLLSMKLSNLRDVTSSLSTTPCQC
jgi:hypothetical protein